MNYQPDGYLQYSYSPFSYWGVFIFTTTTHLAAILAQLVNDKATYINLFLEWNLRAFPGPEISYRNTFGYITNQLQKIFYEKWLNHLTIQFFVTILIRIDDYLKAITVYSSCHQ